jgi:hypothetical protein
MDIQTTMIEETTPAPGEPLGGALFQLHERIKRMLVRQRVNDEGLVRTPTLEEIRLSPEEHSGLATFKGGEMVRRVNGVAFVLDPGLKQGEYRVELIHQRGSVKFERREAVCITVKDLVEEEGT